MLIVMQSSGDKIALNPDEVSQVVPINQPGFVKITMKNRIEHYVTGELDDVMGRINCACCGVPYTERGAA